MEPTPPPALWPMHLGALASRLRACRDDPARTALRADLWVLLHAALMRYLRGYAARARASREDLEDLAAAKALELVSRCESGAWDSRDRSGDEIASYVATAARHGLVDLARRAGRHIALDALDEGAPRSDGARAASPSPEVGVESREFARALRECFETLDARARRVWFLRAYYDMPSREIAASPGVGIRASHVDVIAQRARRALRDCMEGKGHSPSDAPAGAFVELWTSLEILREQEEVVWKEQGDEP